MLLNSCEFLEYCKTQDAELEPSVVQSLNSGNEPQTLFFAIRRAGAILRDNPAEKLASQKLIRQDWPEDSCAEILRQIINASIEPVHDNKLRSFNTDTSNGYVGCDQVGALLAQTFMDIAATEPLEPSQAFEIIRDEEGPLFVRRKVEAAIPAISLKAIIINGIPYPTASELRVDTHNDIARSSFGRLIRPLGNVYEIDQVAQVGFIQPSIYTFGSEHRSDIRPRAMNYIGATTEQSAFMQTRTIEDLNSIVQRYLTT